MSLENKILQQLAKNPYGCSATFLCQKLKEKKSNINRILYTQLLKKNMVFMDKKEDSSKPIWKLTDITLQPPRSETIPTTKTKTSVAITATATSTSTAKQWILLIDLGNVHDVLSKAEIYADQIWIYAFADCNFNGYGINPEPKKHPHIKIFQMKTRDRNSADTQIIWEVARLVLGTLTSSFHFLVATKDQGFLALKHLVEEQGHQLTFVRGWKEVQHFLDTIIN